MNVTDSGVFVETEGCSTGVFGFKMLFQNFSHRFLSCTSLVGTTEMLDGKMPLSLTVSFSGATFCLPRKFSLWDLIIALTTCKSWSNRYLEPKEYPPYQPSRRSNACCKTLRRITTTSRKPYWTPCRVKAAHPEFLFFA